MKRTDEPQMRMSIGHIHIEQDGWVWVATKDGKHELGLGDLNVDVFIHDRRLCSVQLPHGKCNNEAHN
jgi:hypothetical protein